MDNKMMAILLLVVGLLIGFIIGWLIFSGSLGNTGNAKVVLNNTLAGGCKEPAYTNCMNNCNDAACETQCGKDYCDPETDLVVGGGICKCPDNGNGGQCSQHKSRSSCEGSTCTGEFGGNNTGCTWATSSGAIK